MVAFVDSTALGTEWTDEAVVVKSPDAKRFLEHVHPAGSNGVWTESKLSERRTTLSCPYATEIAGSNKKSIKAANRNEDVGQIFK
jgi:hypothetical protein